VFLGLLLRNGNDRHIQAAADSCGNVLESHTLFGDGVVPGSRCAFRQREPVEPGDIRHMRGRPAVVTIADVRRDFLSARHRNQRSDKALLYSVVHLRQAHHNGVDSALISATAVTSDTRGRDGEESGGSSSVAARP
jgi:hypothetical protein